MWRPIIRFIHEYSPDLILVLTAIAIFAVTPQVFEDLFEDSAYQKSLDLALKMLGTLIAVVASIASYRRFFRGRIFAPRLRLKLSSKAVCKLLDGTILHSIDLEVENVGSVTVWSPSVTLNVLKLDSDADCTVNGTFTEGIRQSLRWGGIEGIEPGELVVYHYRCRIPLAVEAFRIAVELSMNRRDAWHRCITVANAADVARSQEQRL